MPIWRLNVEAYGDSVLPRDAMTITPHFNDGGVGSDPQGLCDDLADAMDTYYGGPRQIFARVHTLRAAEVTCHAP